MRPAESSAAECSNSIDDDGDGLVDCADIACSVHAWCAASGMDAGGGGTDGGAMMSFDAGPPHDGPSCSDPLDIVFVLDVSTSMADEAARMRDGIASVWTAAHRLTTSARFGLVVFVDDALAVGGCSSFADLGTLQAEFDRWRAFCASNRSPVSMQSNSDCPENSLDAIHLAASMCAWRPSSTRILIHVTDDTFAERPAELSGFGGIVPGIPVRHTYEEVAALLVSTQIRVGAFAAPTPEDCGAGSSSDVAQGFSTPYRGMPSLPTQTGGAVWSIRDVRAGTLDMAEAINRLISDEYCTPFLI